MRIFNKDLVCLLPTFIFLLLVAPYFGQAPSLDPMINYRHSISFFQGGFPAIISEGSTAHPPLLYLLNSLFFNLFGQQPLSINLLGVGLFFSSSLILYRMVKEVFQYKVAAATTLLLFLNPLVMVNFFYVTSEILILSGIIFTLWCYLNQKLFLLSVSLVLLALMKETALAAVATLFLWWTALAIYHNKTWSEKSTRLAELLLIFTPALLAIIGWRYYLGSINATEWIDTPFMKGISSSYQVIIKNILDLNLFNSFLKGNLFHIFRLNFQWVYFGLTIVLTVFGWKKLIRQVQSKQQLALVSTLLVIATIYALLVLSFPTWTIPRYSIPLLLPFFLMLSLGLSQFKKEVFLITLVGLVALSLIANETSLDPMTSGGRTMIVYGVKLYDLPFWNNSPDRIMYNLQFPKAVKNQNTIIKKAVTLNADIILTNCNELKLSEKLWSMYLHRDFYPEFNLQKKIECINIDKEAKLDKFQGKIIYNPATDYSFSPLGNI